jgi:hypothetical protein
VRYLFALPPEVTADTVEWANSGEPVIPQFPHVSQNHWLSVVSFKPAPYAEVRELPNVDIDQYADDLVQQYPGLPRSIHETYVLTTAKLAQLVPVGSKLQVYITQNTAKVLVIDTEEWIELWNQQPTP